jgi:hypothetical protein
MRISRMLVGAVVSAAIAASPFSVAVASAVPAPAPSVVQHDGPGPGDPNVPGGSHHPFTGVNREGLYNGMPVPGGELYFVDNQWQVFPDPEPPAPGTSCPQQASDGSWFNPCGI